MKLPKGDEPSGIQNGHHENGRSPGATSSVPESVHDEMLQGAIDAVFRSEEESYEQFLQNFPHLTVGGWTLIWALTHELVDQNAKI